MLQKEAQQPRYQRDGRRPVELQIVKIVPRPAAERHGRPTAQAPQQAADEAEHMSQRQHAHQAVFRLQRKLLRAVEGALAKAGVRQDHGLGTLRCSGGKKQDFSRAVGHSLGQVSAQFLAELRISPKHVDIRVGNQPAKHRFGCSFIQQHQLHPCKVCRKELNHAFRASVREQAKAGFSGILKILRPFQDSALKIRITVALPLSAKRDPVRALCGPVAEQIPKSVEAHGNSLLPALLSVFLALSYHKTQK